MANVLPYQTGLTVDGVIYQYSTVKNPSDYMTVSVQNKNAQSEGYIFRSVDDWTGLKGTTITKIVPVDNIPASYWGNGEIRVNGNGYVQNPSVVYKYRYDMCVADPLSDPACPGYAQAWANKLAAKSAEAIDPLSDENVRNASNNKTNITDEEKNKDPFKKEDTTSTKSLDAKKKSLITPLITPNEAKIAMQFELMNNIPGFDKYGMTIPGGVYVDTVRYPDKFLPDNRQGRRMGMAQESLHKTMVDSQYNK